MYLDQRCPVRGHPRAHTVSINKVTDLKLKAVKALLVQI